MKSHPEYVRDEFVAEVREQIKNYRRFKRQTNRWVDLVIKHAKLKMKIKVKILINSQELGTLKIFSSAVKFKIIWIFSAY